MWQGFWGSDAMSEKGLGRAIKQKVKETRRKSTPRGLKFNWTKISSEGMKIDSRGIYGRIRRSVG